jgi:hypothetical protein
MGVRHASLLILLLFGFLTFPLTRGQDRATTAPSSASPAASATPGTAAPQRPAPGINPATLEGAPRQFFLGAQRGAEWLTRANGVNGRFLNGWVPSLNVPLEGDSYLRQAGAAFALARVGRLTGEERYSACAARALLSLLDETVLDSSGQVRHTPLPSIVLNRLGSSALLVLAINELPAPPADLLEKSEQLCNHIRRQARADGSLACGDPLPDGGFGGEEPDAVNCYPGAALYALARSAKLRPADWKLALVRKSVSYYLPWWRAHRNVAFLSWHTAAYAETYLLTRDRALADAVFEMADWLVGLQYDLLNNNQHPEWMGGFKGWSDGRAIDTPPTAKSADCAEALTMAWRVARQLGDDKRCSGYEEALLSSLQFVGTLQYTDANTTHFVPGYRDRLAGAFHASTQDGTLRLDYTQHAVSAMALFVELAAAR